MSINEFSHYSLFPGLFIAFTYNNKQTPAFGASPAFLCILLPFLGLSFCHIPNNLSNYNALTANACPKETLFFSFVSNFVRNSQMAKEKRISSFLHLARDDKERVSSIDEQRNDVAVVGIALFFSPFLLASSDPFVLNFFLYILLAYMRETSLDAMGFGLCRSKMLNGIVARHSPPMRNDAAENNGTLLRSARCVGSRLTKFKDVGTTTSSLCILPRSCSAHHELGWGGWWFRDPVENASFMPRVLATACIHSVILPLLNSWTLLLNIITLLSRVLGTSSIRSGLLASVHSFATNDTRGLFLWRFFLLMTGISIIPFSHIKQQASFHRTYQK
ncbi:hypothetical protein MKW92_000712 [Papaver armeniacum]|nr:hypothetical protein MKW92_000712 [Papaver armeniacum]